jgi:hypothetical protein
VRFLSDFDARRSSLGLNFFCFAFSKHLYSFRLKINAIVGPIMQTNVGCEVSKIPFVFYEKHLVIDLSFM